MDVEPFYNDKKSRYNSEVYIDECSIPTCKNKAEDTHHIGFQCTADKNGLIGTMHKNHRSNLVPLCKVCHKMVHMTKIGAKKYIIHGYVQTTDGLQLNYDEIKIVA